MAKVVAANRRWRGPFPDPVRYQEVIAPQLAQFKLTDLMAATGLTKGACSRIRAGQVVPHPRHWLALERLVQQAS